MYDVAALGELLVDFVQLGVNGEGYPTMQANPGGAPCNFLAAMSAYGARTAFIGKVGGDTFGKLLINTMKNAGVDTHGVVVDKSVFTTLAFVTTDGKGERSFSFARKPGADLMLNEDEIDYSIIDDTAVFHFGSLSLTAEPAKSAVEKAVAHAAQKGKLISFDPNLRLSLWSSRDKASERMLWGLERADIVKMSIEEAEFLWGSITPEAAAEKLLRKYSIRLAMITMGAGGSYIKNRLASVRVKCPKVEPVDTTGAGDIFGGSAVGFILGTGKRPEELEEEELTAAVRFATAAASLSTEKYGGISSIPDKAEVLRRIGK